MGTQGRGMSVWVPVLFSFVRLRCKDKHNIPIFKEIRCISYNGHEKTAHGWTV